MTRGKIGIVVPDVIVTMLIELNPKSKLWLQLPLGTGEVGELNRKGTSRNSFFGLSQK